MSRDLDPTIFAELEAGSQRTRLNAMRKRLDRDGTVWNEYAPAEFRVAGSVA